MSLKLEFSCNLFAKMITTCKVFSLLLILGSFSIGNSLDCTVCNSGTSWDDCQKTAKVQTCTVDGVNELHAVMGAMYNPTLVLGDAGDEFQCFAVQANLKNPAINEATAAFSRACTFKKVDFCKGWLERIEVVKCGTNPSGDVVLGGAGGLSAMGALIVVGFFAVYSRM